MSPNHRFRLLAFDFDGTLADSSQNIYAAARYAFAKAGLPYPGDLVVGDTVGLELMDCAQRWLPEGASFGEIQEMASLYKEGFIHIRKLDDFHEPLFDGVHDALGALAHEAVFMGVCTGKNRHGLDHMLDYHGIAQHFNTLQTPDTNRGKPAPDMMISAMNETGVQTDQAIMIGDTTFDMMTARSAGALAIGVSYGHHRKESLIEAGASLIIDHISDLPRALAELS